MIDIHHVPRTVVRQREAATALRLPCAAPSPQRFTLLRNWLLFEAAPLASRLVNPHNIAGSFCHSRRAVLLQVEGLQSGRSYSFRLRASNEKGQSSWSETANTATMPAEPSPCPTPSFAARTATSIRVRWEAPAEDGGATITSYRHVKLTQCYPISICNASN